MMHACVIAVDVTDKGTHASRCTWYTTLAAKIRYVSPNNKQNVDNIIDHESFGMMGVGGWMIKDDAQCPMAAFMILALLLL